MTPVEHEPLGVGLIGAGPVVQSIHLPALARHRDKFRVTHIFDVNAEVARAVAEREGASSSADLDRLLDDPSVDVVAVCSPHQFHADQTIRALKAGKRAVLCEKPLAVSPEEATQIAEVSEATGVPLIVGAMHLYDSGWRRSAAAWKESGAVAHTIRSSIVLPPNRRFEDFAVEPLGEPPVPPSRGESAEERSASVERGLIGLAVHDLPLVRLLAGGSTEPTVLWAEAVRDMGYRVIFRLGNTTVDLYARIYGTWQPRWTLEAIADDAHLEVVFTPSYVLAGSAEARLDRSDEPTLCFSSDLHNGYESEWLHLSDLARGATDPQPLRELIADLTLTLNVASGARDWILRDPRASSPTPRRHELESA